MRLGIILFGAVLALLGVVGLGNAIRIAGEPEPIRKDLVATGKVTHKNITEFEGLGGSSVGASETYSLSYQFTAADGQSYRDNVNVDWDEFQSYIKGARIDIQYWAHNPRISSPVGLGYYTSAADYEPPTLQSRLLVSGSILLIGLLMLGWQTGFFTISKKTSMPQRRVI